MTTAEVIKAIGIPRDKLYYLEQKGFINPKKILVGERESRDYSGGDVEKIGLIWKYVREGFRYRVAYQKAIEVLGNSNYTQSPSRI
jgi:DNA-binding transcriptional MerR regulator